MLNLQTLQYRTMKFPLTALLLLICCVIPIEAQTSDTIRYISVEPYDFHLLYLRADSAILIDVREPFEFRGRRLGEAVNIPSSGNITRAADTLKKHYSLFLYCTTDFRSRKAAEMLFDKGFRRLFNLEGGIVAWKKDGMPVVKGAVHRAKGIGRREKYDEGTEGRRDEETE